MKTVEKILDIFFPPRCPFCKEIPKNKIPVCPDCIKELPFVKEDEQCIVCGRPLEEFSYHICHSCRSRKMYFEHAFIPLIYKGIAKDRILALKKNHPYYAKAFAYLLADRILSSDYYTSFDCVTFVPQSSLSFKYRGYNQAELIAKELADFLKIPCVSTLEKTNEGKDQHTLSAAARRENARKSYLKTDRVGKGTVLLVDDIYTTGSTANYCSRLLREMGYEKVYLAIALIRVED